LIPPRGAGWVTLNQLYIYKKESFNYGIHL